MVFIRLVVFVLFLFGCHSYILKLGNSAVVSKFAIRALDDPLRNQLDYDRNRHIERKDSNNGQSNVLYALGDE